MNSESSFELPITEQDNPRTINLSSLSSEQIVRLMNEEDELVTAAVRVVLPDIARAVDAIVKCISSGGRLFYIGTGTSGRLGVLDAAEIPPTFGVSPNLVQAVIAGGYDACHRAVEASEDNGVAGREDLKNRSFDSGDVLVGIAASGGTPYTLGGLTYANELSALTIALTCVPGSPITQAAQISIVPVVGPEVVTGSTRLKAGTAQKMVLNMLSTAAMTKLGYVSGNRMTNVKAGNKKLRARALRILITETGLNESEASRLIEAAGGDLRVALVMSATKCTAEASANALLANDGVVRRAVETLEGK